MERAALRAWGSFLLLLLIVYPTYVRADESQESPAPKRLLVLCDKQEVADSIATLANASGDVTVVSVKKLDEAFRADVLKDFDGIFIHIFTNPHPNNPRKRVADPRRGRGWFDLTEDHKQALLSFVESGGGIAASGLTMRSFGDLSWPELNNMLVRHRGGSSHIIPDKKFEDSARHHLDITTPNHPLTQHLPNPWLLHARILAFAERPDEDDLVVLVTRDHTKGDFSGQEGRINVAWLNQHGKGRVFAAGIDCNVEAWKDPHVRQFIWNGTRHVLNLPAVDLKAGEK